MKRIILSAALLVLGTNIASADYVLIKIDVGKFASPPAAGAMMGGVPAGDGGGLGQAGGAAQAGAQPGNQAGSGPTLPQTPTGFSGFAGFNGAPPIEPGKPNPPAGSPGVPPEDPNAKWVSAVIEIKNKSKAPFQTPFGLLYTYDHKWSTVNSSFLPILTPMYPWVSWPVEAKTFSEEFSSEFTRVKNDAAKAKDKGNKAKIIDNFIHLARMTLSRGQLQQFHLVMKEAEKLDDKHAIIKNYRRVEKALAQPLKNQDPAQGEIIPDLVQRGYREAVSRKGKGHFAIYSLAFGDDRMLDALIERRLRMMEETLETFYYWFAVQKENSVQPNLPKYRLNAIVAGSKDEFKKLHLDWGSPPMAADGFTARRENLIVMSAKVRLNDPVYHEFESILTTKLNDINEKLAPLKLNVTRDDLLTGRIRDNKASNQVAIIVAAAQTAVVCAKAMEEEAERHTVSHETISQLLIASEMFPRNVQTPDWMIEGLTALFETSAGSVYPTIGAPHWRHTITFKHHFSPKQQFDKETVLRNVVTDSYFQTARKLAKEAQEQPGNPTAFRAARESGETARATAWSYTFFLATIGKLDYLFNYGKQLDKLPRDMDLNPEILQSCFAVGFDMKDSQDARQIDSAKIKAMAEYWFDMMPGVNLKPAAVQAYFVEQRAKQEGAGISLPAVLTPNLPTTPILPTPPNPGVNPPPNPNPMPPPPPPPNANPMPPMVKTHEELVLAVIDSTRKAADAFAQVNDGASADQATQAIRAETSKLQLFQKQIIALGPASAAEKERANRHSKTMISAGQEIEKTIKQIPDKVKAGQLPRDAALRLLNAGNDFGRALVDLGRKAEPLLEGGAGANPRPPGPAINPPPGPRGPVNPGKSDS